MSSSSLDQAIDLMRAAQRLLDAEHPVIAAHLETVIGIAVERCGSLADDQPAAN